MAAEPGVRESVELRLNAREDKADKLLSRAKLLVHPSRLDSLSLSVLRSLSCGTPAVACGTWACWGCRR
jgi:glycosyltransferase involved in cell wall biosynthesis